MTPDEFVKAKACEVAWHDGKESGVNGMLGILFVIRNRARSQVNNDWLAAIPAGVHGGLLPDVRDPLFLDLLYLVDSVYDGRRTDSLTDGATDYATDVDGGDEFTEQMERVAQVGNITFYKEK